MPLLLFFQAPLYAFWGRSKVFRGKESIPPITVELDRLEMNREHLSHFNKICDIKNRDEISLIYPITLVFPFFQRILCLKQAPLSLFNVLGKRLKITQCRQIGLEDALDIFCETNHGDPPLPRRILRPCSNRSMEAVSMLQSGID